MKLFLLLCVCVIRPIAPLGVDVDGLIVRVPSHVAPVRKGRHRQWRCHLYGGINCRYALNPRVILEERCRETVILVPWRAAPLGVEIDAVVVRVPAHVVLVRMGCHRQWRRQLHARSRS